MSFNLLVVVVFVFVRMIPAASKDFLMTNLVSGVQYDVCVLAAWEDTVTTLTATNVLGCTHFFTEDGFPMCQPLPRHLLGGTVILVAGCIIVATLLMFIIFLMVRYKTAENEPPAGKVTGVCDTYSQTNGGQLSLSQVGAPLEAKVEARVALKDDALQFRCGSLQSSVSSSSSSSTASGSQSPRTTLAKIWRSAHPKPRSNLDHLLGTFSSLELRGTQTCNQQASSRTVAIAAKSLTDRKPLLGRTLDCRLSRLLMLPRDCKPKRSQSFDISAAAKTGGAQACNKPRRISKIWTKRSLSVNSLLLTGDDCNTEESNTMQSCAEWVVESTV